MQKSTHRVYWTEDNVSCSKDFTSDELDASLKHCESLRKSRIAGKNIGFIAISSEIQDCVSLDGVDAVDINNYEWKKRRK